MRRASAWLVALALAGGLVLLGIGLPAGWLVQAGAVFERAGELSPWQWLGLLAGILLVQVLRACRVHAEWGPRAGVGWVECLHVVAQHYAVLNLLPMRTGEAGFAWLLWRRWGVRVESAAVSLVLWRLQDGIILLGFACLLLWPAPLELRLAGVGAIALAVFVLHGRHRQTAHRVEAWAAARRDGLLRMGLMRLSAALTQPGSGATPWVCGLGTWAVKLMVAAALLSWLAGTGSAPALSGAVAGELGAALPLQPFAGFGVYEAAVWAGVSWQGGAPGVADVLTAALLVHLLFVVTSLALGGASWLATRHVPAHSRESHLARPSA